MKDRVVLITGGSKGIGKGMARVFTKAGATVVIAARTVEACQATADELKCHYILGDVTQWEDLQRMVEETLTLTGGKLDILCANAGSFPTATIDKMDPHHDWDAVLNANLKSTFLATKAVLPHFTKQRYGRIVVTSSITGTITGMPGFAHYGASKAGQVGFVKSAALELAPLGITINAVLPGNIYTEGLAELGDPYLQGMRKAIPQGRLGTVEDVGYAVLFLASEEASFITGQTLVVDGGQVLPESSDCILQGTS